jgi:putative ABC transport system permease protein
MPRTFRINGGDARVQRDVSSEIAFHIEMRTRELIAAGVPPDRAREEAVRAFGDVASIEAECRDVRSSDVRRRAMRDRFWAVLQDARFAARGLRRTPGFTIAAVCTLALGIGANTAIFSVLDGTVLRRLPYGSGDRLLQVQQPIAAMGIRDVGFSPLEMKEYEQQATIFAGMAEYHSMAFNLYGHGDPMRVQTGVVSAHYFDVLGVRPLEGRTFRAGEDKNGAIPVLLLSYEFWQNRLGADPNIVGQTFVMNDRVHTVIGVLPPLPRYPDANEVYMPISSCPFRSSAHMERSFAMRMVNVVARLKPGVPIERAERDVATISRRLHNEHPDAYPKDRPITSAVSTVRDELTRTARPTLTILLGTAALVLLIACTSVANLLLARQVRRERELAVRAALGAGRGRILRLLLSESMVLALLAGGLGVALAAGGLGVLRQYVSRFSPRSGEIRLDLSVLLFTLAVSLLTGLLFGALPALATRRDIFSTLRESAVAGGGVSKLRARSMLITAQVAVAFVLLVGAGLMLRSLVNLQRVEAGYDPENVLAARVDLNWSKYNTRDKTRVFADALLERLSGQAGVNALALASSFPLNDTTPQSRTTFDIQGRARDDMSPAQPMADFRSGSPEYFKVLGVSLLRGRTFEVGDRDSLNPVAVISQSLARKYWPNDDPLGARVSFDRGGHWIAIVGVVGDVKEFGLGSDPAEQIYLPIAIAPTRDMRVLIRTTADPLKLAGRLRDAVRELDPIQPVSDVTTLEQARRDSLASPRLATTLLALFAVLALAITAAGLGGVIAFSVGQRTQEIGVRIALGADRTRVVGMVLRQGARLALFGLAIGAAGAYALARVMRRLLFGVGTTDPATFVAVAAVLVAVALLACFLPARRASAIDPASALRAS